MYFLYSLNCGKQVFFHITLFAQKGVLGWCTVVLKSSVMQFIMSSLRVSNCSVYLSATSDHVVGKELDGNTLFSFV